MPSLKEFRNRIASVKSTRKITSAMKMVAASKLRKAQQKAEDSRAYSNRMVKMIYNLVTDMGSVEEGKYPLLSGNGKDKKHLLLVLTSDNGLCGGFNSSVTRLALKTIRDLIAEGKEIKLISIGKKGGIQLRKEFPKLVIKSIDDFGHRDLSFKDASEISNEVLDMFKKGEFDICTVIYNEYKSVIAQLPITKQLIPFGVQQLLDNLYTDESDASLSSYIYEPKKEVIFENLLPLNFSLQVFRAMLDNSAGEKAARMTAMDSATNNADAMIDDLTLKYNRARQAYITKELIEIISGAEAV